jgi:hypothetical protein
MALIANHPKNFITNLGKRTIEVITVSGHTAGTIVLLDRNNGIVFPEMYAMLIRFCFFPIRPQIEVYGKVLSMFKQFQLCFAVMWGSRFAGGSQNIADETIELCDEILTGTDDAIENEHLDRLCFYGKKKNANFKRPDGKIRGTVARV